MVANADVFASSSSSDTDNEVATPVQPKWQGRGLGLVFSPDKHDFLTPEFESKRMSTASYASSESDYPEDEEEDFEEAHRKRKAALMGIVNGLELSHPEDNKPVDDDSEYNGVEGLAIGGSGEVDGAVSESEYEDDERPPTVIVSSSAGRSFRASSPSPARSSLKPSRDAPYYEAVSIAQHSHVAAARQRRAFGIPPSESDEVYRGTQAVLSHADSVLSEMNWQDDEEREDLSEGAVALFRTLSGGRRKSRTSSVPEKEVVTEIHRGDSPTQRQDVFRTIRETEATFVQRITHVIRLFVLPLRVQDSKAWISGVPLALSRLFDWLEDILNLHTQILEVLQSADAGSEGLRQLVPRLEIYQPYLVRLAESVDALKGFVEDGKNDFGEFVRMQQTEDECDGWSLERFLVEPVNRIAVYPGLFKQLLDATPGTHGDHLSTVCLVRSTELMIKVMTEVKLREDEYEFTKTISRRISGLSDIARRDRRLLQHGQVHRVHQDPPMNPLRDRSSRLVNAINDWDNRRARSGSTTTASSASSWEMPPSPSPSSRQPKFNPPTAIHLFVFSDLLVSCVPLQDHQDSADGWALCEDIGITRILEVKDDTQQDIFLELLPVYNPKDIHCKYIGALPLTAQLQQLKIRTQDKAPWLEALQHSARTTSPLLSIPMGLDYEDDRLQRTFVDSLVESGLPIPRSPSFQFEGSDRRQEREERGWWSLRFREVLRDHLARGS
ncbi:Dbl homology domain-containing protein [Hymenopellis radicata]|nr:Dbl homology domain-containing protein [Hymenopellis radicata]